MRERSSYQITRYLNLNHKILSSSLNLFLIRYHWKIKEDFLILKNYGKNSREYFERKNLQIPELSERISFIESFILLYYLYRKIWKDNINVPENSPNSRFWNVIFNEENINLQLLEEFYEKYSSFLPYINNTETVHKSKNYIIEDLLSGKTDANLFFDRESSNVNIMSFRPFILADSSYLYMIHGFSKPYKYSKLVHITRHSIYHNNQSYIASILLPNKYFLYDSYIYIDNGKKKIRIVVKHLENNSYKYTDFDIESKSVTPFSEISYEIFENALVERVIHIHEKYRAILTAFQNCKLKLYIAEETKIFRETFIPDIIYHEEKDPLTLHIFASDEFIFLFNWTKLTYGIYRIYENRWETGVFEELETVKDLRAYIFPDTKNRIKILINKGCGIRASLSQLTHADFSSYGEGISVLQTDFYTEDSSIGHGDILFFDEENIEEKYESEGIVITKEKINFENYHSEGIALIKKTEHERLATLCDEMSEITHEEYLALIKQSIDTFCMKKGKEYYANEFVWLNEFLEDKTVVYELEVHKNLPHEKRLIDKRRYIDLATDIFSRFLPVVPAMFSCVSFVNSYGSAVKIYESFQLYRILRYHSILEKTGNVYIKELPYNCGEKLETMKGLACFYQNLFLEYFAFDNSGLQNIEETIVKYNNQKIDQHYDVFNSFLDEDRLKIIIKYFMPFIYEHIMKLDWKKTLTSIILTLTQYLGADSSISVVFDESILRKFMENIIFYFFPIHSKIIKGYTDITFDEKIPNIIAIDDSFLVYQCIELYDFVSVGESIEREVDK